MNDQARRNRARGALLGQAVGDALGTTVEFATAAEIRRRCPGGHRDIIGQGPFGVRAGQVTDDTELALALARSLVGEGRYDADAVARAYVGWMASGPFDSGITTQTALLGHDDVGPGLGERVQARASRQSQANGAVMRQSPLGLFCAGRPVEEVLRLAALDASLTHPNPVCLAASGAFVFAIAHAVATGDDGPATFEATWALANTTPSLGPIVETLEAARTGVPSEFKKQEGWVRIALQAAFFHLLHTANLEEAVVDVVARGGDTDTNGCITGALVGAVVGASGVPGRWIDVVLRCQSPRPATYHCADVLELADGLLAASAAAVPHEVELERRLQRGER